jgi:hypothetical protein
MDLVQRLIIPVNSNLTGLGLVSLLHHQLDELGLIQISENQHILALLHIDAATDDELCILS